MKQRSAWILVSYILVSASVVWATTTEVGLPETNVWRMAFFVLLAIVGWFMRDLKRSIDDKFEDGDKRMQAIEKEIAKTNTKLARIEGQHGIKNNFTDN